MKYILDTRLRTHKIKLTGAMYAAHAHATAGVFKSIRLRSSIGTEAFRLMNTA